MEEVIGHDGRFIKGTAYGVIVPHIQKPFFLTELPHLRVQLCPVAAIFVVDCVIKRDKVRALFRNGSLLLTRDCSGAHPQQRFCKVKMKK